MPESLDGIRIRAILQLIGERIATPSDLVLIGGGALALLGSPRLTVDIDFIGDDILPDELGKTIMQVAKEQNIYADPVPLAREFDMNSSDMPAHLDVVRERLKST
jgi:hypothetical protein